MTKKLSCFLLLPRALHSVAIPPFRAPPTQPISSRINPGISNGFGTSLPVNYCTADVKSAQDSFPGGTQMPGRTYLAGNSYHYGFNEQEISTEISTGGNLYTAELWEHDTRSSRRWNLDPKPNNGISQARILHLMVIPFLFSDPLGDTLSNPQLADALKMASSEIKNRLKNNQGFYNDDARSNLDRGVVDYILKNKLNLGDAGDFQDAVQGYHNGLGTIVRMSTNKFNNVDAQIINNKNLNSKNTIISANFYIQHTIILKTGKVMKGYL